MQHDQNQYQDWDLDVCAVCLLTVAWTLEA